MSKEFKDGYEYANQQLKLGVTPKELEIQIDDSFDFNDFVSGMIARWREIQQLLAQPEQTEQESVAWGYKKRVTYKPEGSEEEEIIPLYTSPPKREPLSEQEITDLWANKSPANEFECVRLVEKAHGITGVDDE